jgi:hypothetical protein
MVPDITLYAAAIRVDTWLDFYDSIGKNQVTFEVIFAGPNKPNYKLPKNFTYIQTNVKPVQCIELAVRQATADLIMHVVDDCRFIESSPLDHLYELYKEYNNPKLMLSPLIMAGGITIHNAGHHLFEYDTTSPVVDSLGIMGKELYTSLGGADINFIATLADIDISLRGYKVGCTYIICDVGFDEITPYNGIYDEYQYHDRALLDKLWSIDGKWTLDRTQPFEPFSDYKILEKSQGPKGRWL